MLRVVRLAAPLALALAAAASAPATAESAAAHSRRPAISHLRASEAHLPYGGGTVTITARVARGVHCTLRSSRPVHGLPKTVRCHRKVLFRVKVPANSSTSTLSYVLTLRARGHGSSSARVTVRVAGRIPAITPPAIGLRQISAGYFSTCAVLDDGHVYCWGGEYFGELGDGSHGEGAVDRPSEVSGISDATRVAVGEHDACALLSTGHVECWGENKDGQVGDDGEAEAVTTPTEVAGIDDASAISVGLRFACALLDGGTVKCWGSNIFGDIGAGVEPTKTRTFLTPEAVDGVEHAVALSSYDYDSCVVIEGGEVRCWGNDDYGQLGNGEHAIELFSDTPVKAREISAASAVAVSSGGTCVLLASGGSEACWGLDEYGQLGDGTETPSLVVEDTPQEAHGIAGALQIAVGEQYACTLLAGGHEDCWGRDDEGQVGDGEGKPNRRVDLPKPLGALTGVTQISAGPFSACAIADGSAYCWGNDELGELGNGASGKSLFALSPAAVSGLP
jgi:alpha-tubulin suppressor-like RCC1 family protein